MGIADVLGRDPAAVAGSGGWGNRTIEAGLDGGWKGARNGRLGRDPVAWRYENGDRKDRTEVVECEKNVSNAVGCERGDGWIDSARK